MGRAPCLEDVEGGGHSIPVHTLVSEVAAQSLAGLVDLTLTRRLLAGIHHVRNDRPRSFTGRARSRIQPSTVVVMTSLSELKELRIETEATLLRAIASATEKYNSPGYLRSLAEAHALARGSLTGMGHVEVKAT